MILNDPKALGGIGLPLPSGAAAVVGILTPASTDNAICRWDTTTGTLVQNSVLIVADTTGALSGFTTGVGITWHGGGTITGASGSLVLTASGTDQSITLTPSGTGEVIVSTTGTSQTALRINNATGQFSSLLFHSASVVKSQIYWDNSNTRLALTHGSTEVLQLSSTTNARIVGTKTLEFGATSAIKIFSSVDSTAGDLVITPSTTGAITVGTATAAAKSVTRLIKTVAAIADNTGTAVLTVTIPNAAHSASVRVTMVGSLGAGGAIGANEATGTVTYDIAIARTAGVNAVVTASTAYGSGMANVAGAATITVVAAASSIAGAVGDPNTFTVNVTIAKGSGSSANHTALVVAEVLNSNATGVSIA